MGKYELVIVVDAANSQEEKEAIIKDVAEIVEKSDGKIINRNVWLDKHKFSFPIKKKLEGTYYMLNLEAAQSGMVKLRQLLKLKDKVLRSLLIRV